LHINFPCCILMWPQKWSASILKADESPQLFEKKHLDQPARKFTLILYSLGG
jgi:hypothetical protein